MRDRRHLSDEKRELIRQVILELFAEQDFGSVGVREICATARITPNTLYKHFGTKEELLIEAVAPDLTRLDEAMEKELAKKTSVFARTEGCTREYFKFYFENVSVARVVFLTIPSAYFVSETRFIQHRQIKVLRSLMMEGRQSGIIRSDVPTLLLIEVITASLMRVMFRLLRADEPLPDPKRQAQKMQALLEPFFAAPGKARIRRR